MSSGAIIGIAVAALVLAAVVVVLVTAKRGDSRKATGVLSRETRQRDRSARSTVTGLEPEVTVTGHEVELAAVAARTAGGLERAVPRAPAPYVPMDPEQLAVTRRQFLNRANVTLMIMALSGFGASVLAFLWPSLTGGFGAKITVGKITDINNSIRDGKGFYYVPEGRAWITSYPSVALPKAKKVYPPGVYNGMEQAGIVALYQKCVHLGCRVPQCESSQWFECPCHGSQYNRAGEKKGGPAPRGLDRFPVTVADGVVSIDTSQIIQGPVIGTNTTGQEAEGPHCVTGGEH